MSVEKSARRIVRRRVATFKKGDVYHSWSGRCIVLTTPRFVSDFNQFEWRAQDADDESLTWGAFESADSVFDVEVEP